MTDPRFKMSDNTREYYKDSLNLVRDDLFGPGGYDEVYILTNKDFNRSRMLSDGDKTLTGIPFVDQGQEIKQLRESSPEYYAVFKNILANRDVAANITPEIFSDAAVAIKVSGTEEDPARKIGIVFLSEHPASGMTASLGSSGLSSHTTERLLEKDHGNFSDFKKFVVLPHEMGHLVDSNKHDTFQFDTSISLSDPRFKDHMKSFVQGLNHSEIVADEYAQTKFSEATKRGLTSNPSVMETFLNYRTLVAVDSGILNPGEVTQHATTPFMADGPFHGQHASSYRQTLLNINGAIDSSAAKLMGDYVTGEKKQPASFWEASVQYCFNGASDKAYLARIAAEKDGPDTPSPSTISDAFRACMVNNFSNRYHMLTERYGQTQPGTPENQLLGMYVTAAETEIPSDEEVHAKNPVEEYIPKPGAGGIKPY